MPIPNYHKSVLKREIIEYLAPKKDKIYVDATLGGGGHTEAILQTEPTCKVIAFDWDKKALEQNQPLLEKYAPRLSFVWGNFADIYLLLKKQRIAKIDGLIADFGTSQHQIFHSEGFSFQTDTFLDMRMSQSHQRATASDLVNTLSEQELILLLQTYGEEHAARRIARAIVQERAKQKITTTRQLSSIVEKIIPAWSQNIHPATKTFQALRIAVNRELDNIKQLLSSVLPLLTVGGRLVCISFHSLEDRIVKNFFREKGALFKQLTPKPITAQPDELAENSSARSAKLRAVEKIIDKDTMGL